ncbi:MAG TPA: sulfatase-like hydrolase/transferase [Thermoanaerobaculia bacterium]|nr:sulfatase-like hydrolase/transferase [Thermoanaerobaculia bacterium]
MRRLLFLTFLSVLACTRASVRPSNHTPVILISIDTLRSDHLPSYGFRGIETPAIDAFRNDAILFQRAYSHVPLTLPSHATMFTGVLPAQNGLRDNTGFRLAPNVPTLAELLHKNGYATGAAVSAFVLRRESGISRGFDFYEDQIDVANSGLNIGRVQRSGKETVAIAERWIEANSARPFFMFVHLYEPHTPYDPPEPYLSRYSSRYDGEIAYADSIVAGFLDELRRSGVYDRALILLLSDHGEGLDEHGESEHGIFLYREALQVPLIVKLPHEDRRGTSVSTPVGLSDVFATIAEVTATTAPKTQSVSLLGTLPPRQIYSETLFPKFHYGWSDLHSLLDEKRHYIQAPRPEMYDIAADPAEKNNILSDDRRTLAAMRAAITPLIQTSVAPAPVSAEEARKLAALGYIGSAAPVAGDLPDPKDKIASSADLRRVFGLYERGQYEEALPLLEKLVRENPRMLDVWDILSRTLENLGRTEDAIEAAKHGLRLSPNASHLALMVGRMSLNVDRIDDAERHAELAMSSEPAAAHDLLARVALKRHDLERAEREAKLALEDRDHVFALMTLGQVEIERKNYERGLAWCNRAIDVLKKRSGTAVKGLYYLRGDLLARLGRDTEAEEAFRKEIELFPRDAQAYKNLILLYITEGRNDEATKLVFQLVDKAPIPRSYVAISTTLKTVGDDRGARYWAIQGLKKFPRDPALRKMAASS